MGGETQLNSYLLDPLQRVEKETGRIGRAPTAFTADPLCTWRTPKQIHWETDVVEPTPINVDPRRPIPNFRAQSAKTKGGTAVTTAVTKQGRLPSV